MQNDLLAKDPNATTTESGNIYIKTNTGKKLLTTAGLLFPVIHSGVKALSQGSKAFNWKQLAVKCPILALAGLGIGALIDSLINSSRANKADEVTLYKDQQKDINYKA
jgi:hypothetical protein